MTLSFSEDTEREASLFAAIKLLSETEVEVGLPPSAGGHLSFILAIQEHGSPIMHIPPRPVIRPALSQPSVRESMAEALVSAAESAFEGNAPAVTAAFETAGQAGADGIRSYIDSGISPPNSPVTVSGGWIYNRVAKTGVPVSGKGFNKPLYRTGALYNAFSYEVKKK